MWYLECNLTPWETRTHAAAAAKDMTNVTTCDKKDVEGEGAMQ